MTKINHSNCQCGYKLTRNGTCYKCYRLEYNRIRTGYYENQKKLKERHDKIFNKVIDMVKKGYTIQESCELTKVDRTYLYKIMTSKQKAELISYKKVFTTIHNHKSMDF